MASVMPMILRPIRITASIGSWVIDTDGLNALGKGFAGVFCLNKCSIDLSWLRSLLEKLLSLRGKVVLLAFLRVRFFAGHNVHIVSHIGGGFGFSS